MVKQDAQTFIHDSDNKSVNPSEFMLATPNPKNHQKNVKSLVLEQRQR
jgi:hypothetical protein